MILSRVNATTCEEKMRAGRPTFCVDCRQSAFELVDHRSIASPRTGRIIV